MFYYTYNNEEDLYIHPQDPFRTQHSTQKGSSTQTEGEMKAGGHTRLLLTQLEDGCSDQQDVCAELFFNIFLLKKIAQS